MQRLRLARVERVKNHVYVTRKSSGFKKINDIYGHLQTDKILFRMAQLLQTKLRKYDVIARFGGEEFFILFPKTSLERAGKIAERLRKAIVADGFLSKYKVTISGGVASYKNRDNFERLSQRADKSMYKAKKNGRNRICFG